MELQAVRERLVREREGVERELESLRSVLSRSLEEETDEPGVGNHYGDLATETYEREMDVTLADNAQHLLEQYDEALARLDQGTYGRCVVCGREIEPDRLEALPYTVLCAEHARDAEAR